jgi:hypothetical protein
VIKPIAIRFIKHLLLVQSLKTADAMPQDRSLFL